MPASREDHDLVVIVKLCSLLRENGTKILSGESKFALTSQSLSMICTSFRRLSDVEYADGGMSTTCSLSPQNTLKWKEDVNFLKDFIITCPSLKIIHGTNTMQGAVQVQRFKNLHTLEVKKVPIHMIEGLHHLRNQLETIIVSRSLQHLQDLFETCGSDMSSPMSWPHLINANLSFNSLTILDGSLRLLPVLQILDLSHNSLQKTDNYLEYLTKLQRLNLGYNMLDVVPSFSISAKGQLKTLVLKNNSLDNIEGIEDLVLLEELDLCDNCLSEHDLLQPLSTLVMLQQLRLNGNPVYYHAKHRKLTVKYLSSLVVSDQFELDNKNLTPKEIKHSRGINSITAASSRRPSAVAHHIISEPNYNVRENLISKEYKFEDSDNIATSLPVASSRKKRRKAKHRVTSDISDLESSTTEFDSPDTSAASSPRPDYLRAAMKTRKEIELFRSHYGPDWLKAMEDEHVTTRHHDPATSGTSDSDTNQSKLKEEFDQPISVEVNNTEKLPTEDDLYLLETSGSFQIPQENQKSPEVVISTVNGDHGNSGIDTSADKIEKKESPEGIYVTKEIDRSVSRMYSIQGEEFNRTDEEEEAFYGEESEPFIVSIENENKELILTCNQRYVIEKDLNGCIIDKLDLKSLRNYETGEVKHNGILQPTVLLYFDYIKKDRRLKSYIMEDHDSVQRLVDLILPHLIAVELKSVNNSTYQCLKCSNQFTAKDGVCKKKSKLPTRGSSKDLPSLNSSDKISYKCPKCGSDLVFEVEGHGKSDTGSGSASSTPYGSYTSSSYLDKKLYSPSQASKNNSPRPLAKSTPVKVDQDKMQSIGSPARRNIFTNLVESFPKKSVILIDSGKGDDPVDLSSSGRRRSNAFIAGTPKLNDPDLVESPRAHSINIPPVPSETSSDITSDKSSRTRLLSESDITILHTSSLTRNQSSHSSLHSLDKQLSVMKEMDEQVETTLTCDKDDTLNQKNLKGELTPVGSPLSFNVCNDMVSSVYLSSAVAEPTDFNQSLERTDTSDISVLCEDSEENTSKSIYDFSTEKSVSSIDESENVDVKVDCLQDTNNVLDGVESICDIKTKKTNVEDDFTEIDHRLKLHLMMSLFENDEEFKCILETDVCQYLVPEEYHAFVVLSSEKFYILKITSDNQSEPPANWLKCLDIQPVTELFHVDVGLDYQSVRVEFGTDCSSYTLIIKDNIRCQNYVQFLQDIFHTEEFSQRHQMKTYFVTESCPTSLKQLQTEVLTKKNGEERILVCYLLGYLARGMNPKYPVSYVITDDEVILVKENHQWPQPRLQAPLDKNTIAKHFTVLERHKITNIVTVEKFSQIETKLCLTLLDEESGGETVWNVSMETKNGVEMLIEGIRTPWEAEFGVELEVTEEFDEES